MADEEDDERVDAAVVQVEVEDRDDEKIASSPPLGGARCSFLAIVLLVLAALLGLH